MSSQITGVESQDASSNEFGANEWLVDELYEQYIVDKNSVDQSWWPILERYHPVDTSRSHGGTPGRPAAAAPAAAARRSRPRPAGPARRRSSQPAPAAAPAAPRRTGAAADGRRPSSATAQPVARTTSIEPKPQPIPAEAPRTHRARGRRRRRRRDRAENKVTPLRGMAKALATNMDASLTVPTATSVRTIPAKLMIDNRIVINNHLKRARGGKVSFTHLIGWALIQALKEFPSQNVYYDEVDGKPSVVAPAHINLGLAIDIPKPDGTRALLVPGIKRADTMGFGEFVAAYEDLVAKARGNKLTADDFAGTTISLTNPGGIGTEHSVPAPHARPGLHHRRRSAAIPGRVPRGIREDRRRPGHREDHHAHLHLRPPRHPGRRLRRVPQDRAGAAHRRARLLRGDLRRAAHPVRPDPLGHGHQRRPRRRRRQAAPACRSSSTPSACAAT